MKTATVKNRAFIHYGTLNNETEKKKNILFKKLSKKQIVLEIKSGMASKVIYKLAFELDENKNSRVWQTSHYGESEMKLFVELFKREYNYFYELEYGKKAL